VPLKLYELIINRQPYCISIYRNEEGVFGYFALLAVEEQIFMEMQKGKLTEMQLDDERYIPIVANENNFNGKYIYILSILTSDLKKSQLNFYLFLQLRKRLKFLTENFLIKGIVTHFENKKLEKMFRHKNTLIVI
jgi:hypothetical protein